MQIYSRIKKKNSRENYFRQLFATNENCIENESRCCGQPFDRAVNSFSREILSRAKIDRDGAILFSNLSAFYLY